MNSWICATLLDTQTKEPNTGASFTSSQFAGAMKGEHVATCTGQEVQHVRKFHKFFKLPAQNAQLCTRNKESNMYASFT